MQLTLRSHYDHAGVFHAPSDFHALYLGRVQVEDLGS